MDETDKNETPKQICSIRIGFAVETDEQAIEYKKKITDILSGIPNARIEFSLSQIPTRDQLNASGLVH